MLTNIVKKYLTKNITILPLSTLYQKPEFLTKTYITNHNIFIKKELPIRLAYRIVDLMKLPYGLPSKTSIKKVINLYCDSIKKIHHHKLNDNIVFSNMLMDIKEEHTGLELDISNGIMNINDNFPLNIINYEKINKNLDNFFHSRISIRNLILQNYNITNNHHGILQKFNINDVISDAIIQNNIMAERNFYDHANFKINNKDNIILKYIPSNFYFIILEILKNSTIAHHKKGILDKDINIDIYDTDLEIIIKITDYGNSFSYNDIPKVFGYNYTTNNIEQYNKEFIIGGYGFGLPLVNVYMKYMNGRITINPIINNGTEVFLYFNKNLENLLQL